MKTIYYLSYYSIDNDKQLRSSTLAGKNKIDYILRVLDQLNHKVCILSAAGTNHLTNSFPVTRITISDHIDLKYYAVRPWTHVFNKFFSYFSVRLGILFDLLKVGKNNTVIVYHSLAYMRVVNLAHRIRKFRLILEAEEVYADVIGDEKLKEREIRYLKSADAYIFPTVLLNEFLNKENKPYSIIHGTYLVEQDKKSNILNPYFQNEDKDIIHCVYAGTMDPRKGGAIAAAAAAEFLPSKYHIHILGFGSDSDVIQMKALTERITALGRGKVTYDGVLSGEEYIQFIQCCDIGLSTQNPDADFNATSFPSKILSYLANGLRVVSIRIPAIETSGIDDLMYYYDEQTPEKIAQAILKVDMTDEYDGRKKIQELSNKFEKQLELLIDDK